MGRVMQEEQVLLAQVAAGDEEALHQLYRTYRPRLRRYLWHHLDGDLAAVEEALQDVFLAVWRSADGYRAEARVSTWVYQIAHHVAVSAWRRLARQPETHRLDAAEERDLADEPATTYEAFDSIVLDQMALEEALDSLSSKHREVLTLVFQYGFALQEAAQILDVPIGTVKSRINYARKSLMRALETALAQEVRHDA